MYIQLNHIVAHLKLIQHHKSSMLPKKKKKKKSSGDTSFRPEGLVKSKFPGTWRQDVVSRELLERHGDLHRNRASSWRSLGDWAMTPLIRESVKVTGHDPGAEWRKMEGDLRVNWTYPPGSVSVVSLFFLFLRVRTRRYLSHRRIRTQRAIASLWKTVPYMWVL